MKRLPNSTRRASKKPRAINQESAKRAAFIANICLWVFFTSAFAAVFFWDDIRYIVAATPQAKCEVRIESGDTDSYCTKDGEKRSHEADRLAKEKTECEGRSPYFEWRSGCYRVKYESRQACIDDSKQGVRTVHSPADEGGGSILVGTRCLEDGTWEGYDPLYEEYKERQANRTICKDVTSYDYNWSNDMLCARPDGSQFYTSYEDAQSY